MRMNLVIDYYAPPCADTSGVMGAACYGIHPASICMNPTLCCMYSTAYSKWMIPWQEFSLS